MIRRYLVGLIPCLGIWSWLLPPPAFAQNFPGQSPEVRGERSFVCASPERFRHFSGTLDDSMFAPGSGFSELQDAELVDGYLGSRLSCIPAQDPGSWGCLGYAFNTVGAGIIEAQVTLPRPGMPGSIRYRRNGGPQSGWSCSAPSHPN